MNLDLGVCMAETLKKSFKQSCEKTKYQIDKMHCLHLQMKCQKNQQNESISINNVQNNNTFINMTQIQQGDRFLDMSSQDMSLKKLLDLEFDNKMAFDENQKYKKFLEYMEKNYENQFKSQKLNIKDLNLQIQELLSKLKCSENSKNMANQNLKLLENLLNTKRKELNDTIQGMKDAQRQASDLEKRLEMKNDENQRLKDELLKMKEKDKNNKINSKKLEQTLRNALKDQKNYIDQLIMEKMNLKQDLMRNQMENNNLQNKLQSASQPEEYKQSAKTNDSNPEQLNKVKQDNDMLQNEIDALKQKMKQQRADYMQKDDDANKEKRDMKKKLNQLNGEIDRLNAMPIQQQEQVKNTPSRMGMTPGEAETLKNDLEKSNFKLKQANMEKENCQKQLDDLEEEQKEMKKQIKEMKDQKFNDKFENENLKKDNDKLKKKLHDLGKQMADQNENLNEEEKKNRLQAMELAKLKNKLADLNLQNDQQKAELDELKHESRKFKNEGKDKIDALESLLLKQSQQGDDLSKKFNLLVDDYKKLLEEHQKLQDEHKIVSTERKELDRKLNISEDENEKLLRTKNSLDREQKKQKILNEDLTNKLINTQDKLKMVLKELEQMEGKLNDANKKIEDLNKKNHKQQQDYLDLGDDYDKEKEERRKFQAQNQNLKNDLEAENYKRLQLEKDIEMLKVAIEEAKQNSADKESLKLAQENYNDVTIKFKQANEELEIQTNNNQKLKLELEKCRQELAESQKACQIAIQEKEKLEIQFHQYEANFLDIFNQSFILNGTIQTVIGEIQGDDFIPEPNPYQKFDKQQIPSKILFYLQDSNEAMDTLMEEVEEMQQTRRRLIAANQELTQKYQEVESQKIDISQRHDRQLELAGKLSIKLYILYLEFERHKNKKQQIYQYINQQNFHIKNEVVLIVK